MLSPHKSSFSLPAYNSSLGNNLFRHLFERAQLSHSHSQMFKKCVFKIFFHFSCCLMDSPTIAWLLWNLQHTLFNPTGAVRARAIFQAGKLQTGQQGSLQRLAEIQHSN